MKRAHIRTTLVLSVAIGLAYSVEAQAWQPGTTAQASSRQVIQFNPPVEGTCRVTSGGVTRGRIVSISEAQIVMRTQQNRELTINTSDARIVRTSDGAFQFQPESDDFSDAVRRASALDGVQIAAVYTQPQGQPMPNQPPTGVGAGPNRPPVGVNPGSTVTPPSTGTTASPQVYSSTPGFSNSGSTVSSSEPTTGSFKCTSCGNEISADSRLGQTCPHCGVVWVSNPVYQPRVADTSPAATPTYTSTPPTQPTGAVAGGQGGQVQPSTVPPPVAAPAADFSFETMPIWAKVGACLGFIGVLYLLVAGRR